MKPTVIEILKRAISANALNLCQDTGIQWHYHNAISLMSQGTDKPIYHGRLHIETMMLIASRLIYALSDLITRELRKEILTACMYHDVLHSLGHKSDSENIQAVKEAMSWMKGSFEEVTGINEGVIQLIEVTEYPYTRPAKTLAEKVMRDADLLGMSIPYAEVRHELWTGLYFEMLVKNPDLTIEEFAKKNKEFMTGVDPLTYAGQILRNSIFCRDVVEYSEERLLDHFYKNYNM